MAPSATFCNIPLSTSVDPLSATSRVSLDWVLSAGIPTSRSVASGVLILPCSNTVCSMHTKLSVTSNLPYDLVLGRDWLFFCREMLPHSSFDLSSGTVTPGQPPAAPLGPSVPPGSNWVLWRSRLNALWIRHLKPRVVFVYARRLWLVAAHLRPVPDHLTHLTN
ncbi:hypothetical protein C8R44DRAFT_865059 [Mycena epipterygia]|nr:hypothetical protein C8R44DRAFT_865059 [Mycena epipterygia]